MTVRYHRRKEAQMQLLPLIYQLRQEHPTMGARDMYYKLKPEMMGRDGFEKFCKEWDLIREKPVNYRRTTDSSGVVRFENLIENLEITKVDQVWQSDITYFEVNNKFYYITLIQDAFSRRILGHAVSSRLFTEQTTLPALKKALKTRGNKKMPGLILHSDGGGQYYESQFLKLTEDYKINNSMCKYPWENGKVERLNGVIKNNYLRHRNIKTFTELQKEVDRTVLLYNKEKPHKELQRKAPVTFEIELLKLQQQTRPKMIAPLEAKQQICGASSPAKSEQTQPQNQDVLSAIMSKKIQKTVNVF